MEIADLLINDEIRSQKEENYVQIEALLVLKNQNVFVAQ